jgi:hypothetical protein
MSLRLPALPERWLWVTWRCRGRHTGPH